MKILKFGLLFIEVLVELIFEENFRKFLEDEYKILR